jgi:hypothetical protein
MAPVILGFTGTRKPPTLPQRHWANERMRSIGMTEFHHGCCVGSDETMHYIAVDYFTGSAYTEPDGGPYRPVKGHPPLDQKLMMPLVEDPVVEYLKAFTYLTRNMHIVKVSHRMLSTPRNGAPGKIMPSNGSGTWWTINKGLLAGQTFEICYPDGKTEVREP